MSEKKSESESMKLGSEELSSEFQTLVSSDDLRSLNHLQHTILGRLQDSNAVLSHFNDFSQNCFTEISGDMARNTRVLKSIKSDLDYIFLKLRNMKTKLSTTYPDAFPEDSMSKVIDRRPDLEMPKRAISGGNTCRVSKDDYSKPRRKTLVGVIDSYSITEVSLIRSESE